MLAPVIQVKVTEGDVERYRGLLRGDWSRDSLDDVLALLWKLIADGVQPSTFALEKVLPFHVVRKSAKEFNPTIIDRIRDLSVLFTEPSIPTMPNQFPANRPSRIAAQAEQAWTYLILQALANLEGATGLFADTQSLLFLCSAHFLLPQLQKQDLTAEHDCLVCAMYLHTVLVWKTLPGHMLHLQSVLMDHLGNRQRQLELLDMSFLLTSPEDHAYLTRATAYWSALMDFRRYEKAEMFLYSLLRHAPDVCQQEVREMLAETFAEATNGSN